VSDAVVVVGPTAITGPGAVDPELARIALDCIDDELALVDDRPVSVDDLLRDVLASAARGTSDGVVLVHPSWWPVSRVGRIRAAGREAVGGVVVLARSQVFPTASATVEVAAELVVVHANGQRRAIARGYPSSGVVDAVEACLVGLPDVAVDAPANVASFGAVLARALRHRGIAVTVGDDRTVLSAAREVSRRRPRRVSPRAAAIVVAVASASGLTAAAVAIDQDGPQATIPTAWLVEGRVAVEVPVQWVVERVTAGTGSARVQVVSPEDRSTAIHLTQSRVPNAQTLDTAAESLRAALADEPDGVFVDFVAAGTRAHRAAITYREVRADRHVDWTVLLDDGVRIAIGCQGGVRNPRLDEVCDRAVGSAHAVARK
jgi:type VII secretion-associated protein (TIGR03931 family)